jgi:ribosome biogenesis GTPase
MIEMKGTVIKSTGSWCTVRTEQGDVYDCKVRGNFRIRDLRATNPVAVGDSVKFSLPSSEDGLLAEPTGQIDEIYGRKNYIIRRASNLSKEYQIIASNIDQVFLIITVNYPVTTTTFIDRFLVTTEAYQIPCVLVFNKTDCYNTKQQARLEELIAVYSAVPYCCISTSAKNGTGLDEIRNMAAGKINLISGHSGVGKSTIINCLEPALHLKVGRISSAHDTGMHTTTNAEMFPLSFGGHIIDTPGIKGFGLLDMEHHEIGHYFPEIFALLPQCQYSNCSHVHEPGCAVKIALADGHIAKSRYLSYLSLLEKDNRYRD